MKKLISLFLVLVMLLTVVGCNKTDGDAAKGGDENTTDTSAKDTPAEVDYVKAGPWKQTVREGDFIITLSADNVVYETDKLDENSPFYYKVTVEYTGDRDGVGIAYGAIAYAYMTDDKGVYVNENVMGYSTADIVNYRIIEKEKPYVWEYTGDLDYKNMTMTKKGEYVVNVHVEFSTDEKYFKSGQSGFDWYYVPDGGRDYKVTMTMPIVLK